MTARPEPAFLLRPGAPGDAAAVRDLVRDAYAPWVPVIGREPLPVRVDYGLALLQNRFDLAFVGGALAGLIETSVGDDHLLIVNVAVAPDCQGRGLGRSLLQRAEAIAAGEGLAELRLYTNARFERNIALYARLGYAIDREEPFPGGTVIHMSKRIPGADGAAVSA